jgi:hypothetical protein
MKTKSHLIFGVPAAILGMAAFVAGIYLAQSPSESFMMTWGPRILLLAAVVGSVLDYRKKSGDASFSNLFANGFRTTAVIAVLLAIFVGVYIAFGPGVKEKFMAEAAASAAKEGYPQEVLKDAQETMRKMLVPMTRAGVVISILITGAIFSALSALILKKQ